MIVPKIIHQLWIGNQPAPTKFMDTWKNKHPEFEYIFWNENELMKRNFESQLGDKLNDMEEINGKADILRWEILYAFGGIFIDADSICIEPLDHLLELNKSFASYENEVVRGPNWCKDDPTYDDVLARTHPLIATGTMGFPPRHILPKMAIEWIKNNEISVKKTGKRAWRTVGPGLLTRLYYSKQWDDIIILPSYYFLPVHCSGFNYHGHGRVYAHQEWGSTKNNYVIMNSIDLPDIFLPPTDGVSVLICSLNTKYVFIKECLDSIKNQLGHFHIEIIWINDGSDALHTTLLKKALDHFIQNTRFTSLKYSENNENMGVSASLNRGVTLCSYDLIIRMDSDDIMINDRIYKQLMYMKQNPRVHICGGQVLMFRENIGNIVSTTNHDIIVWDEYKKNPNPSHWLMNHPTLCYRKQTVLNIGNYNKDLRMIEDFDLELRMLRKYKMLYNFKEPLLYYRLHNDQVTHKGKKDGGYWHNMRNHIIKSIIATDPN